MLQGRRIVRWWVLAMLTATLAIACANSPSTVSASGQQNSQNCRVVEHDLGTTEVCGKPQTVVVLSVNALDLLLSLDVQPRGVATRFNLYRGDIFDDPARQIPYLGDRVTTEPINVGQSDTPSLEKLASLDPDLILGEAGQNAESYDLLSQIAPTILWNARTVAGQWQENLRDIAKALGEEEKAEAAIDRHTDLVAAARKDLENVVTAHPQLLVLGTNRVEENLAAISPQSYLGQLLEDIGFKVIPEPNSEVKPSTVISLESLPKLNAADTIIVLSYNTDIGDRALENLEPSSDTSTTDRIERHQLQTIRQNWQENAIAQSLTASQKNRVFFATYYKWNGLNGPIGTELVLEQLRQFLLEKESLDGRD